MNKEETIMLNDFLKDENVQLLMNDDLKTLSKKINIMTQQALLQEQFQKSLSDLNVELEKLNKKKK